MLSYLHSFHAGCLADVHKHGLLSLLLTHLTQKDRPLAYMETHAGRGLYDLRSLESLKTGEAEQGILALQDKLFQNTTTISPALQAYESALKSVENHFGTDYYPGSPLIAKHLLRDQDQLHLMELHPKEIAPLKGLMRASNCHVHHRDGYEGVLGIAPPKSTTIQNGKTHNKTMAGVVLIDPSYEVKTEYGDVVTFVEKIRKKWPQACIAIWYPILHKMCANEPSRIDQQSPLGQMLKSLDDLKNNLNAAHTDLIIDHRQWVFDTTPSQSSKNSQGDFKGMTGTGFYMINAPYGLKERFDEFEAILKKA